MIFRDSSLNKSDEVHSLGDYNPYWLDRSSGTKNSDFDQQSRLILDIKKEQVEDIKTLKAVAYFFDILDPLLSNGIAISVVPSGKPEKRNSGLYELARQLASHDRIDATSCLVRYRAIDKLAFGGNRGIDVHLNSVRVENRELVKNREVLLLDDVSTSGNSLNGCKRLLEQAGARAVQCVALGKTTRKELNQTVEVGLF